MRSLLLLLFCAAPLRTATALRNLSFAGAWDLASTTTLVNVRVQKTASKSLVHLLERRSWLLGSGRGASNNRTSSSLDPRPSCQRTGWLGQTTSTCREGVRRALQRFRSQQQHLQLPLQQQQQRRSGECLIDGHCGLDTLVGPLRHANQRRLLLAPPPPPSSSIRRHLVITLLREPVARTISEFRHVCAKGTGQWDYSTWAWRTLNDANSSDYHNNGNNGDGGGSSEVSAYDPKNCSSRATFLSFLTAPGHANGMRNRQTRMLGGAVLEPKATPEVVEAIQGRRDIDNPVYRRAV